METENPLLSVVASQLQSTADHLRNELKECRAQVLELQDEFRARVNYLTRLFRKMESNKENVVVRLCPVTLADSETQTCEFLPRRWNSDLSLDLDGKSNGKRYQRVERSDLASFCLSNEAVLAPPVIRVPTSTLQKKSNKVLKSKFTNRLDVSKHPADSLLLADLGLTTQAPEFSQSEFNLSSDDHWLNRDSHFPAGSKGAGGGRVRFLSHDDGQGMANLMTDEEEDIDGMGVGNDLLLMPGQQVFHSQSASWATLTHSERDLSEMDSSAMSLNGGENGKPAFTSSTPYKGLRSKFKQSVSFHGKSLNRGGLIANFASIIRVLILYFSFLFSLRRLITIESHAKHA